MVKAISELGPHISLLTVFTNPFCIMKQTIEWFRNAVKLTKIQSNSPAISGIFGCGFLSNEHNLIANLLP